MESLNDIATTGAAGAVTVIGMGTVFACLVLLYGMTRAIGAWLPRLLAAGGPAAPAPPEPVETRSEYEGADAPPENSAAGPDDLAIVAAATLVLARHRVRRARPAAAEATGVDAWKIAGRIQTLRDM
jgi:Na+-transporting methylmalonyl-CoA/oxaloacetate decarboxylase gamma subunit